MTYCYYRKYQKFGEQSTVSETIRLHDMWLINGINQTIKRQIFPRNIWQMIEIFESQNRPHAIDKQITIPATIPEAHFPVQTVVK